MNWLIATLGTAIGKKLLMALTGLSFIGFLCVHFAGNLTLFAGSEAFNAYADHLHALGVLLTVAEWGLLTLALVHVVTGAVLFFQNLAARPSRYAVNATAGGRTLASATMPYTGLFILGFVVFHLTNFHFVDKSDTTIHAIVSRAFDNPLYVAVYVLAMAVVALHVSHGLWSAFQTLGANHPKYMPLVMAASLALAVVFGAGFGFMPIFVALAG